MPAERVDAGDARTVVFTVTAAADSAPLSAGDVSVTLTDTRPGGESTDVVADVVVAVGGLSATVTAPVSWPADAVSGLWAVHVWVVDGDTPVESGARWFYVVAAND